jgi:accessory Sec system S-layer assembly protein
MLPFLNKLKKAKGKETKMDSADILDHTESATEEKVETELSLHPTWKLSKEKEYVLRFLQQDLQPLKPNQLSLAGVELETKKQNLVVTAFVRNSLAKAIRLEKAELLLLSSDKKIIARQEFNLSELGEIPAKSSRPWRFIFDAQSRLLPDVPTEDWSLAFNLSSTQPHRLDLDSKWEEMLPETEKQKLQKLVKELPKPHNKEINIMGLSAKFLDNGNLTVTVLFRNGNYKGINIQQLPLEILDESGNIVAKGGFHLESFEVKANTSKPWTFIFPKELVQLPDADLSKWKARVVQQSK